MNVNQVVDALHKTRASISKLNVPDVAGVYAIYLKSNVTLQVGNCTFKDLIYVGKTDVLSLRENSTHFKSKGTGFSTLRRSIGALLKKSLQLTAIPRGPGKSKSNFTNYRFDDNGEDRLTEWMSSNLELGICPIDVDLDSTESSLIDMLTPVLCLMGWKNPNSKNIRADRKICADEARTH